MVQPVRGTDTGSLTLLLLLLLVFGKVQRRWRVASESASDAEESLVEDVAFVEMFKSGASNNLPGGQYAADAGGTYNRKLTGRHAA